MTVAAAAPPTAPVPPDPTEVAKRLQAAGVPPRFADCRLRTFEARKGTRAALDAATALAQDDEGAGLVLMGPPGTGKTHLAVSIVAERIEAWLAAWPEPIQEIPTQDPYPWSTSTVRVRPNLATRFLVVPSFLDRLRAAARWAQYEDPLPELFDVDLVVLDDLGREKVTDWATERLYVLVNERYNRCRPTVVTSNYLPDDLLARGYEAIVSRLTDGAELVAIAADDYRRRGR